MHTEARVPLQPALAIGFSDVPSNRLTLEFMIDAIAQDTGCSPHYAGACHLLGRHAAWVQFTLLLYGESHQQREVVCSTSKATSAYGPSDHTSLICKTRA